MTHTERYKKTPPVLRRLATSPLVALLALLLACTAGRDATDGSVASGLPGAQASAGDSNGTGDGLSDRSPVTTLPESMTISEVEGPSLYLAEQGDAPAVGYISAGTPVFLAGEPVLGRVPVIVEGPLKARGWVPQERLALRVRQRGKVRGTPVYLGPGDFVGVKGRSEEPGLLRLRVSANLGREGVAPVGPYEGEYPESRLTANAQDFTTLEGPTPGPTFSLPAGAQVSLYDRPNGQVVATLPALSPPLVVTVLRDQDSWKGVRVGVGPYLVGYVSAALTAAEGRVPSTSTAPVTQGSGPGVPRRLREEASYPLFRLPAGTRIQFDGRVIGLLQGWGYARELNRWEETGEADVFVAATDAVAVRGMVSLQALQPAEPQVEGGVSPPAPTTPPATVTPQAGVPTAPQAPPAPGARRSLVSPGQ